MARTAIFIGKHGMNATIVRRLLPGALCLGLWPLAAAGPAPQGNKGLPPIMHVDPLDEGRGSALHRGGNPHRRLSPEQHLRVAAQHLAAGRVPQALAALGQALSQYPDSAELHGMRASIELQRGDAGAALADLEAAVRLDPDNALFRVMRAQAYLRFDRRKEALADLDTAVHIDPDLVPARFNRGSLLANLGRERQALEDFDYLIRRDPELPAPYFNRGAMYHALGQEDAARADIQTFIRLSEAEDWKRAGRDLLQAWERQAREAGPKDGGR